MAPGTPAALEHPLRRLFRHSRAHRRQALWAALFSALNKLFDVLPEVLIGVAVDVVVNRKASFLARFGVVPPERQLLLLAVLTVAIWVFESLFE
jgi:ATP-binding cassette subfamily B protein